MAVEFIVLKKGNREQGLSYLGKVALVCAAERERMIVRVEREWGWAQSSILAPLTSPITSPILPDSTGHPNHSKLSLKLQVLHQGGRGALHFYAVKASLGEMMSEGS